MTILVFGVTMNCGKKILSFVYIKNENGLFKTIRMRFFFYLCQVINWIGEFVIFHSLLILAPTFYGSLLNFLC